MTQDPLQSGSLTNTIVLDIRKRKGEELLVFWAGVVAGGHLCEKGALGRGAGRPGQKRRALWLWGCMFGEDALPEGCQRAPRHPGARP